MTTPKRTCEQCGLPGDLHRLPHAHFVCRPCFSKRPLVLSIPHDLAKDFLQATIRGERPDEVITNRHTGGPISQIRSLVEDALRRR